MHLLRATPGGFTDQEGIIDLQQTPAKIVFLSAQDTDLTLLARISNDLPGDFPSIRLANLLHLQQPASTDLYIESVLQHAQLVVVSLLGGRAYWPYGVDQLLALPNTEIILLPGDDQADPELTALSQVNAATHHALWRYLREGGPQNAHAFIHALSERVTHRPSHKRAPKPLPRTQIYHPDIHEPCLNDWQCQWQDQAPVALLLFYRAHLQSLNTEAFDQFIDILHANGVNPLPIATASLKDPSCIETINLLAEQASAQVILNTTGFAVSNGLKSGQRYFSRDIPVLQVILAGNSETDWQDNSQGLRPTDIAMNVALPEMDGRIISRVISFKDVSGFNERTQSDMVVYKLQQDRAHFVAKLARAWASLKQKTNPQKRIALILANYPTRDGRIGNGVGLDTPASTVNILKALEKAGYNLKDLPNNGDALINQLLSAVTNDLDQQDLRICHQSMALEDYKALFSKLPVSNQQALLERWGPVEQDRKVRSGRIMIPGIRLPSKEDDSGLCFVGIQPARGYNLDINATYHDPDLVPTHAYLAFYFWIQQNFAADAVIHVGKHGNMEWLPGKGNALSAHCWPEIALGPLPHFYPFIVNDPGEGSQAKRRAQAVIIDHLMPPMTRAETYGDLQKLESLVDEFYQAQDLDQARATFLRKEIIDLSHKSNLNTELKTENNEDALLQKLDAYLCDLKEAQIRGGLHILGESPTQQNRIDTLIAMLRLPRGNQRSDRRHMGLLHALSEDFLFDGFDPLDHTAEHPWHGPKPDRLAKVTDQHWRSNGDTRERLELLAQQLLAEAKPDLKDLPRTQQVLSYLNNELAPALDQCGDHELGHLINGLQGRFVPPGPSGAPTRGRLDVLPTGRNFYSLDTRSIPTPAAWQLGLRSTQALIDRHLQEHGDYPRTLGLSVWGTSTMRTGGDDIAQGMALLGVRPIWAVGSNRVTDFEILPMELLDRPRVDVTLRISGFFRDAFINVVQLFDAAVQAVADLDEPIEINPIRARVLADTQALTDQGIEPTQARQQAGWRIFGSKPGAYGAGLQGLIDERNWQNSTDLANAYLNWGGYAYGKQDKGTTARAQFAQRLSTLEVVVQNQDNREHDILDSDDYYQFQGGMTNAVRTLSGTTPTVYHGDHSNPSLPKIRTLDEELSRVIRSRVTNPKWIKAIRKHGYKGAFEMAATVDYLFAYDATTDLVRDDQYQSITDSYLLDPENRAFLEQHNPDALREMGERLLEAVQRGLWQEPGDTKAQLEALLLDCDHSLETR